MFILFLVRFWLLSGHLFEKSCSLDLVISRLSFEGSIWVLIAPIPGLCIHFTFLNRRRLTSCGIVEVNDEISLTLKEI